jgi:hypothetical protein
MRCQGNRRDKKKEEETIGSLQEAMLEYRKQLEKGVIQVAYQGLMQYMMDLKTHFNSRYPEYSAAGALYHGYMDMTYFPLFPEALKEKKLKIAIVFNYGEFRFEIWLSGYNKGVQAEYWKLFSEAKWEKYTVIPPAKGVDSIVEHVLVGNPDFNYLDALTEEIETGTTRFIKEIESFLSSH